MTHVWTVTRDGKDIGTVEAVSRKGACHEAYEKFGIEQSKRSSISVEILHRDFIRHRSGLPIDGRFVGFDPASPGGDSCVEVTVEDGQIKNVRTLDRLT